MSERGNPGANRLANALGGMMAKAADTPLVLDFGVINADYSLTTNTFPKPVPKGEYSVCRTAGIHNPAVPLTQSYVDGSHSHPGAGAPGLHQHDIILPETMYWIRPGDRVLVAWVQNEAVVIDLVIDSARVG